MTIAAFAHCTFADPDTVAIERRWNLGLRGRGPLAGRLLDMLAFGWTRGQLADKSRQLQPDSASAEETFELSWRFELAPGVACRPDWQRLGARGDEARDTPRAAVLSRPRRRQRRFFFFPWLLAYWSVDAR